MTRIYVDADACPVREEIARVAERHGFVVHMVSSGPVRLPGGPLVRRVLAGEGFDAADDWIAERIGPGDIAVTADIPLAARCLDRGAAVVGPSGRPFTRDNIGAALAMRALKADLRDMGAIRDRAPPFDKRDRSRFLEALEAAARAAGGAG